MNTKKQVESKSKRDENGRWLPGKSPNPLGRPAKTAKVNILLEGHRGELVQKALDMALDGDTTALKICLDRIAPIPKTTQPKVTITGFEHAAGLLAKCNVLISSVASGEVSCDIASNIISMLVSLTKLKEADDLAERVLKLEKITKSK